ncbi:hypothetical protein M2410_003603, partial [Stenotrophomonas chelatiphaga]|nr:hypothetical protein [Stenotrophomonas chelatiphaga]
MPCALPWWVTTVGRHAVAPPLRSPSTAMPIVLTVTLRAVASDVGSG